jgi:hypothetical protein
MKHIGDIQDSSWSLFDFGGEVYTGHGRMLHGMLYRGLGVKEPLEQHLPGSHGHLQQAEQDAGSLAEFAAHHAESGLRVGVKTA